MGGRALKSVETRRYSREEFDTVSKELIDILQEILLKMNLTQMKYFIMVMHSLLIIKKFK